MHEECRQKSARITSLSDQIQKVRCKNLKLEGVKQEAAIILGHILSVKHSQGISAAVLVPQETQTLDMCGSCRAGKYWLLSTRAAFVQEKANIPFIFLTHASSGARVVDKVKIYIQNL